MATIKIKSELENWLIDNIPVLYMGSKRKTLKISIHGQKGLNERKLNS